MNNIQIQLHQSPYTVRQNNEGLTNLTDLWKLAGADENRTPYKWIRQDEAQGFIKAAARFLKRDSESLLKTTKGKYGGTWAVEQLALEYAQYLSPELAVLVNQAFLERLDEEANPELAIHRGQERAIRKWKADGKTDKWIEARLKGVATRIGFTKTLAAHGVKYGGFKTCTNAIYAPLYGGTAEVVRLKKGLPEKVNIRENVSALELKAIEFAEAMAQENIDAMNLKGNAQCELACTHASRSVAKALIDNKKLA
jgi:hypothetical protein